MNYDDVSHDVFHQNGDANCDVLHQNGDVNDVNQIPWNQNIKFQNLLTWKPPFVWIIL